MINPEEYALVFAQRDTGDKFEVYVDGKKIYGLRSISIRAGVDDFTTHEIEYITGATELPE